MIMIELVALFFRNDFVGSFLSFSERTNNPYRAS